jgi:hypothetical protein
MLRKMFIMDSFLRGVGGIRCYQTTHISTYPKKATTPQKKHSSPQGNIEGDRKALAV